MNYYKKPLVSDMDTQNNENKCFNCNAALQPEAKFCSNCGQKHTTGKVPVTEFIYDFFKNVLNIDSKLPQTLWKLLFFPGRLTTEFFKGKHESYLKPMQIFVFMTLLCFTIIIFQANGLNKKWTFEGEQSGFEPNFHFNEGENNFHRMLAKDKAQQEVDSLLKIVKQKADSKETNTIIDTTFQTWLIQDSSILDSIDLPLFFLRNSQDKRIKMSTKDVMILPERELIQRYEIEGFIPRLLLMQSLKSIKHEDQVINYFLGRMSWTFFLLVPFFALILKLVYIRRKRYYVEHLVFTLHFHSLLFTIISLALLLWSIIPIQFIVALFAYLPIYLFISMKHYYKQGWFKTLLKYIFLGISYLILFTIILLIILAIIFVLF